jgi:hypothetical protein
VEKEEVERESIKSYEKCGLGFDTYIMSDKFSKYSFLMDLGYEWVFGPNKFHSNT